MVDRAATVTGRVVGRGLPRSIEGLAAIIGMVVTAPLLLIAGLAVAVGSRGPVLFKQERVGRNGKRFVLLKLRTMRVSADGPQVTARDDDRMTRVGRVLRATKLDELPELWNVVRGDMSLVGPRPEVPRYVDLTMPLWQEVLRARPGLTDPVTLRLRNEEALLAGVEGDRERFYTETLQPYKLRGYIEYLERRTWRSDLAVLLKTLFAVVNPGAAPPPTLEEIESRG